MGGGIPEVSDICMESRRTINTLRLREDGIVCREEEIEEELQQTRLLVLLRVSLGITGIRVEVMSVLFGTADKRYSL